MLRALRHVPRLSLRQYVRQHNAPRKEVTFTTPSTILATYRRHCSDPALTVIDLPCGSVLPSRTAFAHVDTTEYDEWAPIANASTLASALDALDRAFIAHGDISTQDRKQSLLPTWVLLSVLCKTPSSRMESFVAHTLAISHPLPDQSELVPLALLLSAYWLSSFRMYAPLRSVLRSFLRASDYLQPYQVSLLLRILAQAEPSAEIQQMMSLLLQFAIRNHFDLGVRTYRIILENRAASTRIADLVRSHMRSCSYAPNLSHTRALVRIYGRLGRRRSAARYWRRIRLGQYHGPRKDYAVNSKHTSAMLEETLRAHKTPRKVNLYLKYLLKSTSRAQQDLELAQSNRFPTLPGTSGIPKKVWMHAVRANAVNTETSSSTLLQLFRNGIEHVQAPAKILWVYFTVIKGLLRRREYTLAAGLLNEIWDTKERWDAKKVTMAVETLTMVNRPDVALRLLLDLVSPENHAASEETIRWDPRTYAPRGRILDIRAINTFMISLLRIGRPDSVFYIWDTLHRIFLLEPDTVTFAILLKAARFARKYERTLQVALADFGLGRILPRTRAAAGERNSQQLGRHAVVERLKQMLRPDAARVVDGFWRGERAGLVALRVAWQVLVGNWPVLGTFRPPMRAVRLNADGQALSPMSDVFRSFPLRRSHDRWAEGDKDEGERRTVRPYDSDGRTYFQIGPADMMFCALLDLLAEENRAGSVPLVLTWMRYLLVRPSRDTLATALVYWGEVTLEGPWIERWKGEERSQYVRLIKWMSRWVGRGSMPGREHTQRALKRIRWYRDHPAHSSVRESSSENWGEV